MDLNKRNTVVDYPLKDTSFINMLSTTTKVLQERKYVPIFHPFTERLLQKLRSCVCVCVRGGCIQMNSAVIELPQDRWKSEEETVRGLIRQITCLFLHRASPDGSGPQS